MGELATAREDADRYLKDGFKLTRRPMVDRLTEVIVDLERQVTLLKDWVIPGGNTVSAALDLTRTICRRTERGVATLEDPNLEILRYLNRLSDFCWFFCARH